MNFKISELFQDTDGGTSAKRFAFFLFILFFMVMSLLVVFHGVSVDVVSFANGAIDKATEIIKWLGGYILLDKAPAVVRAAASDRTIEKSPVTGG